MTEVELTDDQIVDLIFERKTEAGMTKIFATNSFHEILAKLEERLCYGKIDRSKNSAFCRNDVSRNPGVRVEPPGRTITSRRQKVYDSV